jgi:hypothetical protein
MSEKFEVDLHSDQELVEVFPFGVTLAADEVRPIMLFRDADEKLTLLSVNFGGNPGKYGSLVFRQG